MGNELNPPQNFIKKTLHSKNHSKKALKQLNVSIQHYNQAYHEQHQSLITDAEFDALVNLRNQLAENLHLPSICPSFYSNKADTKKENIEEITGRQTLGTIKKAAGEPQIRHFLQIAAGELFLQPKIDGIAVSLQYEKGQLVSAHTRGNRSSDNTGRDITAHIYQISDITKQLPEPISVTIQGELFANLNNIRPQDLQAYTSARHFTAATINRKVANEILLKQLSFFPWKVILENTTCLPCTSNLMQWGFQWVQEHTHQVNQFDAIQKLHDHYDSHKNNHLPFLTDGVVLKKFDYKNNQKNQQLAWKTKARQVVTTVDKIFFTVGRTGKITVVVKTLPVKLQGRTIGHISLGSIQNWQKKDIAIGDQISVQLSGETIPTFKQVLIRPADRYKPPLPNISDFHAFSCLSATETCKNQFMARMKRLSGAQGLNLKMKTKILRQAITKGQIKQPADIMKFITLNNETVSFNRQLMAIGLPNMGIKSIKTLAASCSNWQTLEAELFHSESLRFLSRKQKTQLHDFMQLPEIKMLIQQFNTKLKTT